MNNLGNQSPTSQTKDTRHDRDSVGSVVSRSVNLKMYMQPAKDSDGKKFSFGVGRSQMYPLHVDEVLRKKEKME